MNLNENKVFNRLCYLLYIRAFSDFIGGRKINVIKPVSIVISGEHPDVEKSFSSDVTSLKETLDEEPNLFLSDLNKIANTHCIDTPSRKDAFNLKIHSFRMPNFEELKNIESQFGSNFFACFVDIEVISTFHDEI